MTKRICLVACILLAAGAPVCAKDWWKPYSAPCVEREDVFVFTQKPSVKLVAKDRYEITFASEGFCDVTVDLIDKSGKVVRHLASGVLGENAPAPFQKKSLNQKIHWNGKDDLDRYVKDPGKLTVRVRLGLKPVFDKRIGGTSGKNIPGRIRGIAIGPDGGYVINHGGSFSHPIIRKFDHDGTYLCSLTPPSRSMPESKLAGLSTVEYEPGKRALHGPNINLSITYSSWMTGLGFGVKTIQPALVGDKLVFCTIGLARGTRSLVHYIHTDGSTDIPGIRGIELVKNSKHPSPRLAVSPDGKRVYISRIARNQGCGSKGYGHAVYFHSLESGTKAEVFVGKPQKPGSDNAHLNNVRGIDCDAKGRVYVADLGNNRIQVFSPEGTYLKTIRIDRPELICVHKKTGAIYVKHQARVRGVSLVRITKLNSFENPSEAFHWDPTPFNVMALDSWSATPRLWLSEDLRYALDSGFNRRAYAEGKGEGRSLTIYEEQGRTFKKIADFYEEARKAAGKDWFGRFNGVGVLPNSNLRCDPNRERLYWFWGKRVFDLKTGRYLYSHAYHKTPHFEDVAFDKRGFMHVHQYPGTGVGTEACVFRLDPERAEPHQWLKDNMGRPYTLYSECPYDYGVRRPSAKPMWEGAIPARGQYGVAGFQHGLGVNMRGDVAVESGIFYVPKMDNEVRNYALQGAKSDATKHLEAYNEESLNYARFAQSIQEARKRGISVYSIRRKPGVALHGATVWTFDRTGEVRKQCAVIAGDLINGVEMDEDRSVYFATARSRMYGDKWFL